MMAGTIIIFMLTLAASVLWLTRALDNQSDVHSAQLVGSAFANLLEQTAKTTLDYSKWDEAAAAMQAGDIDWVYDNIGESATLGEAFQLAVAWRGGLSREVGWRSDQVVEGRSALVSADVLALVEDRLAPIPVGAYAAASFFGWHGSELYAMAASRVERSDAKAGDPDVRVPRLLLGQRVGGDLLRSIERSTLADAILISRARLADRPSLPLMGVHGRPVAYVSWRTPLLGSSMLSRMLPLLLLVTALATSLALVAMALVGRSAHHLVRAERQSSVAARTDRLTGLPNRFAFSEALATPAAAGERAILFLDLNGFKRINDTMGHAAGDLVVQQVAQRLNGLRDRRSMLARIGGDEFVFIVSGFDAQRRIERLARAVEQSLVEPFRILGHELHLQAAVGYAVQATELASGEDVVRQADLAMYEAKRHKAGPVAFGSMIDQADCEARTLERALREALARPAEQGSEFWVAYQPIVDVRTGCLARAEALARWTSPTLGVVPPGRFIAVAERSGLMVELGRRVLRRLCDDLASHPGLHVSLNVSAVQLTAPTFVSELVSELARRQISPSRVEVELTESMVVDDTGLAAARLEELHKAGFSTALDDFGTGYSSIGSLRQMSFDTLKIDRSFVAGLGTSSKQMTLCNAMVLLGQALDLKIVCEGVETAKELHSLGVLGCDLAQGYHFDRPLTIERLVDRWLAPRAGQVAA